MDVPFIVTPNEMQVFMVFSASRPHLMFHSVKCVHTSYTFILNVQFKISKSLIYKKSKDSN
jgi:hypothetical protein